MQIKLIFNFSFMQKENKKSKVPLSQPFYPQGVSMDPQEEKGVTRFFNYFLSHLARGKTR
jgi:hypothetical protein